MKVIIDYPILQDFKFWGGAVHNANRLTTLEFIHLGYMLEDDYPDGIPETTLNDLLWFDFEEVCEWLGYKYNVETDEIERD